ncbi:hypothetical protein K227x_23290 [Rubripirellula lacrimiformis]|uniref:Uncharacterized protein n=1 Tax=Rubripirellula lacrimiformis TaxID=1930273 RepID=A0A517N9X9_9BACT|nr:hypothetical protein [Rubripirellula lacrimiformis]QDT03943.1 hypothetical protein K227x_23290 [Rubripirellula lacrimiformis]
MWDVLTGVVLEEWFGLRLPPSKLPWGEPLHLPNDLRLLYCLDRRDARRAKADIDQHYLSLRREASCLSIFAGFGLAIRDDMERERDGLLFLSRQADHFRSLNDYLFVVQDLCDGGDAIERTEPRDAHRTQGCTQRARE